jgi:choline dehydrogenase
VPIGLAFADRGDQDGLAHDIHDLSIVPHGITLYPSHVHPQGRGRVRLASADPEAGPRIDHELLGCEQDMASLIAVCRQAREIMQTPRMAAKATEELPGPAVQTDAEWADFLRSHAFRANHPIGTCRMGTDDAAVVDPHLRVSGVSGLRVVDASIFPTITSGNTNAPTIMVAERASELILEERG